MKKLIIRALLGAITLLLVFGIFTGGRWLWYAIRPQPANVTKEIFEGVTYKRDVRTSPRPMVIHIVKVDLRADGIGTLVTPGNSKVAMPLKAMTTSEFLRKYDLQVAINGDAFHPWYDRSILSYYPHAGDPVSVYGFAASKGEIYSQGNGEEPTLYISLTNQASISSKIGKTYNAISGNQLLVKAGQIVPGLDEEPKPRTAVALSKSGRYLLLLVVDGRQPGYSEGITLEELARIIVSYDGFHAINLDGGGSSTLVIEGALGQAVVMNSPISNGIPGHERPVGNHLGIYATRKD